ncbi:MAG: terminase TerL endonuclease subunit [Thermoanaerobaculia bacterium]
MRNASDELAIAQGCWFDERRADFVKEWIESYCHMYEGDRAGELIELMDWQIDIIKRVYGWQRWSERHNKPVRRFRRGAFWLPKKNGKSPFLAANNLYLTIADDEPGQKVFQFANDKRQALISHTHAAEMVRQSPELAAECEVSEGRIFHRPTSSSYTVAAPRNISGQEGLNGSISVDEAHVVDGRVANVIRYAGASRAEPLHLLGSTYGNNPDCWGKQERDFGKGVEEGTHPVTDYFFQTYDIPQDTEPEALADRKELIRLGQLSNPSWGHTIDPDEFVDAYESVKHSRTDTLVFMMYRMNKWLHSSNPWLGAEPWNGCLVDFEERELEGRECDGGLDLASVRDLNALALCFPWDDGCYRFLWWYFLPEETARETAHLVPWYEWARDPRCHLMLTPGSAVHHEFVRKTFRELTKRFRIRRFAFDKWGAEETTRTMTEGQAVGGVVIEEGTGVPRIEFSQALAAFSEPTKLFEGEVLKKKIQHNGDPLTAWQMGHCAVRIDANENKKPEKPGGKDDVRKIDGIIAAIMARAVAGTPDENPPSVYETRGIRTL